VPEPASLWRNRDFQLLWIGQAASALGSEEAVWALAAGMFAIAVVATVTPSVRRPPVSAPAAASP
jgi:hypothetical protein